LKTAKLTYRINQQIRASDVRVIGKDGKQVGVLKLSDALTQAHKDGLDLIEIAPNAVPPVVKIYELGKFIYQEEKRKQKEKRASKQGELKEVRFSPFIAEHDYGVKVAKTREFLEGNNKVRLVVVFGGRQMNSKDFGYSLLDRILKEFDQKVAVDMRPKFFGRHLAMVISPVKIVKKSEIKEEVNKINN
jgi:translation initiation factor IF-3